MKVRAIFLLVSFLYSFSLAISHTVYKKTKREDSNLSKYKYSLSANETKIKTPKPANIIYTCNASAVHSDTEKMHSSIKNILEKITTDESPKNDRIDASILSNEFLNCKHVSIEPNCYQKFNNGSVFVPLYNMLFNRSNYIVNEERLFICSIFYDKLFEDKLITNSTATEVNVADVCNASASSNSDTVRTRRSIHNVLENIILENITTTETPLMDLSILSPEFLNCTHIYLEPECYKKLDNGSVYAPPPYDMVFDRSNYLINDEFLFICSDIFDKQYKKTKLEHKFSNHLENVSFVCSCISTTCIALHIVMFIIVKQLRNLPGYCLLSLCFALIGAYICAFVQNETAYLVDCKILGMFLLYYFLASFFWMNVMAYDVWKSIRMATAKLRLTTNRPFIVQYARYSLFAWGTPLMIIILSIIIHNTAPEHSKYRLTFNENTCWFKYKRALSLYFVGPMFTLLLVNILFFVSSFYMISNASMSKSHSKNNKGSSDLWSRLFLSLRLGSVMGFMWIFAFIATVTKQKWIWYLYSLCSALQGVFIFSSFTVSERTRKAFMKVILKRKFSISPTQTTSHHGSSVEQNTSSV